MRSKGIMRGRNVALAIGCGVAMLAFGAASASAYVTTASVNGFKMYVTAPGSIKHSISVFEVDGTSNLYVSDFASGNTMSAIAPCSLRTISGQVGAVCPRSTFTTVSISTGAKDDTVDYRVLSGPRIDGTIETKGGNDGVQRPDPATPARRCRVS